MGRFVGIWFASGAAGLLGFWLHRSSASWLMATLDPSPLSGLRLVESAYFLPIELFFPRGWGGILADKIGYRWLLINGPWPYLQSRLF